MAVAIMVPDVEIDWPSDELAAHVTDLPRLDEWQSGVVSGHMEGYNAPGGAPAPMNWLPEATLA